MLYKGPDLLQRSKSHSREPKQDIPDEPPKPNSVSNIFFIDFCARDTSKAGKKPFSIGVNRIDRGFRHDPAAARSDVKAKKILYRC